MSKFCCVCGREIGEHKPYYCVAPNTFTCHEGDCWSIHRWDVLAARFVVDRNYEYFVTNNKLYQIGNDNDYPRGSRGRHYTIQFDIRYFYINNFE